MHYGKNIHELRTADVYPNIRLSLLTRSSKLPTAYCLLPTAY
jgi:hypothetical protein